MDSEDLGIPHNLYCCSGYDVSKNFGLLAVLIFACIYLCFVLDLRMFYAHSVVVSASFSTERKALFWLSTNLAVPHET